MRALLGGAAVALAAAVNVGAALAAPGGGLTNYTAQPKAEPLTETGHGVTVNDPHRWMEKPERRPELTAWVNATSAHTVAEIAALPGYAALYAALQKASRAAPQDGGVKVAGRYTFFERTAPDANLPVLMVREGGKDRVFLDPAARGDGKAPLAISEYIPSSDGRLVAIQIAEGGAEVGPIRFYDTASGKVLPDTLAPIWGEFPVTWLDDHTVA